MFIFVLLKPNGIELSVSVSQAWFEPSRYSFPLNSIFEENICGWDYNCPRKEGKRKGQISPWPGSVCADSLSSICYFPKRRPLYWSLKNIKSRVKKIAKIRASQCWWITTKILHNSVAFQNLHSISQHTIISSGKRSQKIFFLLK